MLQNQRIITVKKFLISCFSVWASLIHASEIIYIPGWHSDSNTSEYSEPLAKIFPGHKVKVMQWKSDEINWQDAIANAEAFVPEVVEYISGKSTAEMEKITLIGHSLGGRIVINIAAELTKNN